MKKIVILLIRLYRRANDALVAFGFPQTSCRFTPTCSFYMEEAIEKYGAVKGIVRGGRRIVKCHPFFEGGFDPVK